MKSTWPKTLSELRTQVGSLLFSSALSFQKDATLEEVKTSHSPLCVKVLYGTRDSRQIAVYLGDKNSYREISCSSCSPEIYSELSVACSHVISAIAYCLESDQCPFPPGKPLKNQIFDRFNHTSSKNHAGEPEFLASEPRVQIPDRLLWYEEQGDRGFILVDRNHVPIDLETTRVFSLRSRLPGYSYRSDGKFFLELELCFQIDKVISVIGRQVNLYRPKSVESLKRLLTENLFLLEINHGGLCSPLTFAVGIFKWMGRWIPDPDSRTISLDASWVVSGKSYPSSSVKFFLLGPLSCILLPGNTLFFVNERLPEQLSSFLKESFYLHPEDLLHRSRFLTSEQCLSFCLEGYSYPPVTLDGEKWEACVDIRDFHRKGVNIFPYLRSGGKSVALFGPQRLAFGDVLWSDDARFPDQICLIHRDRQKELFCRNILEKTIGRGSTEPWISFAKEDRSIFYQKILPALKRSGFSVGQIESSEHLLYSGDVELLAILSPAGSVSQLDHGLNNPISVHCVLKAKDRIWDMPHLPGEMGDSVYHLSDNFSVLMDLELHQKIQDLSVLLETDQEGRAVISQYYGSILLKSRPDLPFQIDDDLSGHLTPFQTSDLSSEESFVLDRSIKVPLRDYQREGAAWIHSLRLSGLGGILADEMGLGKTLTVLAELVLEVEQAKKQGEKLPPSLVVLPATLLFNWEKEISKHAPTLTSAIHHGPLRRERWSRALMADVILSTYGTVRNDLDEISKVRFHSIIADEAQIMKNPASGIATAMFSLKSSFKLALSGTPVENHLVDLWSIFAFVMPGLLGSRRRFERIFVQNGGSGALGVDGVNLLRSLISPLILRRTKENVLKDLPEKVIIDYWIDPTPEERHQYRKLKDQGRDSLKQVNAGAYRLGVFSLLMTLRRYCCHPELVKDIPPLHMGGPAKFQTVKEKISEALEDGHGVILFSQFVGVLDRFEEYFKSERVPVLRLDGGTSLLERQKMVDSFQKQGDDAPRLFLASLKAGGVGLTLTNADYVFHYDPWWNPQVENQATDRAHRIGQNRTVFVYRFLTRGTVEEHVARLKEKKLALFAKVMADERFDLVEGLDLAEIESLLSSEGDLF
jgi:superfamily II DNA or RNA helicase